MIYLVSFLISVVMAQNCGSPQEAWTSCNKNKDCMVFDNECGFKSAFNRGYIGVIAVYNKCVGPMVDCARPQYDPAKDAEVAYCKDSQCQIKTVKSDAATEVKDLPRRCSSDDQCKLVHINNCCSPDAINKKFEKNFEKKVQKLNVKCAAVNCAMVMKKAVCRNQMCEAVNY